MQTYQIPLAHELTLFLVCAGLIVPFFKHLKINPVLGFLVMGMCVGPFGIGQLVDTWPWLAYISISNSQDVTVLAEWGVIFLMFTIGLELSLDRLWHMRRLVFGLGSSQILISAFVIGALAFAWGNSLAASVLLGGCLALSSTAVVLQLFAEKNQIHTPYGQANVSILLMQDLAVVPILFMVTFFGEQQLQGDIGASSIWWGLISTLGFATAVVLTLYGVGRKLLSPVLHMVAKTQSSELFLAATLVIIMLAANITGMAGLSMALGAFLAGLLLAETEFRHAIEVDIAPFKGLLLGLFFMSVGMGIDINILWEQLFWVTASVVGLFAIKAAIIAALGLAFRLPKSIAYPSGIMLGQGGEFAFVVVTLAISYQLMPEATGHFMLLVASFSMMLTPILASVADRLQARLSAQEINQSVDDQTITLDNLPPQQSHTVIAGYGRVARVVCRTLEADGIPYICIEKDSIKVKHAKQQDLAVYYGDATRAEICQKAQIDQANTLVVTMDDGVAAEKLVKNAHQQRPDLYIIARARDIAHAQRLMSVGATDVILETVEASLQLCAVILQRSGIPETKVRQRIEHQRQTENHTPAEAQQRKADDT